jgi:tetratricopeptide (TPR) repeat protein
MNRRDPASTATPQAKRAPEVTGLRRWWQPVSLVLATLLCYANSLDGPFLFDDLGLDNPLTFLTRRVVWYSFELNRALSGSATWSFHAFNVLVHALAGLFLFGLVRRTLDVVRGAACSAANAWVAWAVALLWLIHPLQTESVAYISQRAESMAGLFTLALFYGFVRAATGSPALPWTLFALASFALGMATKEIVAVVPLLVLLYDRQFLAGGFLQALRLRPRFHAALALAWLGLFVVLTERQVRQAYSPAEANSLVGVGVSFTPLEYARTQPAVLLHYLRLSLWPHPLCLDYAWPAARAWSEYVPQTLALAALGSGTLVALVRASWIGFAGAWFFVILAPTSSFVPIEDAAFEHRMYLSLAAIVLLAVLLVERLCHALAPGRALLPGALLLLSAGAAATLTVRRNQDYRSSRRMWETVVARAPHNPRGYEGLGWSLVDEGRPAEAVPMFQRAIALEPTPSRYLNLGLAYAQSDQPELAVESFEPIQASFPADSKPGQSLKRACLRLEEHYRRELQREPGAAQAHYGLGNVLRLQARTEDALRAYAEALRLEPGLTEAHTNLALGLFELGRRDEAFAHFSRAVELAPGGAEEHYHLGRWFLAAGGFDEAAAQFREAARLDAKLASPRDALARALLTRSGAGVEEKREALHLAEEAAALEPENPEILETLGAAQAAVGDAVHAAQTLERALRTLPSWRVGPLRDRLQARLDAVRSSAARR